MFHLIYREVIYNISDIRLNYRRKNFCIYSYVGSILFIRCLRVNWRKEKSGHAKGLYDYWKNWFLMISLRNIEILQSWNWYISVENNLTKRSWQEYSKLNNQFLFHWQSAYGMKPKSNPQKNNWAQHDQKICCNKILSLFVACQLILLLAAH